MKIWNTKKRFVTIFYDNLKIKIEQHKLSEMLKKHIMYFQHQMKEL